MLLDFEKEKERRERAKCLEGCLDAGEIALRVAEDNPEFAALLREVVQRSSLCDTDKDFVLEGIPAPPE